nr:putative ribonuclease h protein [Quercus suber]
MAERPSSFLIILEEQLQADLLNVMNQEEELWSLKSHVNWMLQGDRNTSFYHVSMLIRRKRNKILNLKDSQGNPGMASGGGILCSESGTWIKAFTRKIGIATSFVAELWALRDGLNMCLNMQISALEIDLDAKVVADLMGNVETLKNDNASIVADNILLISQFPQVKVSHCYRKANRCADALARLGCSQVLDFMYLNSPPPCILNAFLSDLYGLSQMRLYPVSIVSGSF